MADAEGYMAAAAGLLGKLEASSLVSAAELEAVRKDLVKQIKDEARAGAKNLRTARIGATRVLVPTSDNLRKINLISERTRKRMSNFRLSYLKKSQVKKLRAGGKLLGDATPKEFVRHSRRLARHAREFLTQIGELDPGIKEEADAALTQINDNELDLLKLEMKSFTRMKETLLRNVQGKARRSQVMADIEAFDIDKKLWNLSLLEHPKASVAELLSNSATKMGKAVSTKVSQIPKRSHVMVGIPPNAMTKMTAKSRTSNIAWRMFSVAEIDATYAALPSRATAPNWRGLGLDYNTPEWYLPVPPGLLDDLAPLASAKRAEAMNVAKIKTANKTLAQEAAAAKKATNAAAKKKAAEDALDASRGLEAGKSGAAGQRLLDTMAVGEGQTIKQLAASLDRSASATRQALIRLEKQGLVTRDGSTWFLARKPKVPPVVVAPKVPVVVPKPKPPVVAPLPPGIAEGGASHRALVHMGEKSVSISELAASLGRSTSATRQALVRLQKKGLVVRDGTKWRVVKPIKGPVAPPVVKVKPKAPVAPKPKAKPKPKPKAEPPPVPMTATERMTAVLWDGKPMSVGEVAGALSRSSSATRQALIRMEKKGLVVKDGTKWRLKTKGVGPKPKLGAAVPKGPKFSDPKKKAPKKAKPLGKKAAEQKKIEDKLAERLTDPNGFRSAKNAYGGNFATVGDVAKELGVSERKVNTVLARMVKEGKAVKIAKKRGTPDIYFPMPKPLPPWTAATTVDEALDGLSTIMGIKRDKVLVYDGWGAGRIDSDEVLKFLNGYGREWTRIHNKFPKLGAFQGQTGREWLSPLDRFEIARTEHTRANVFGTYWAGMHRTQVGTGAAKHATDTLKIGNGVWSSSTMSPKGSALGTFRHEYGHGVHAHMTPGGYNDHAWRKVWNTESRSYWKNNVSLYSGHDNAEMFAESFSFFTHPDYVKGMLPEAIETYLENLLL